MRHRPEASLALALALAGLTGSCGKAPPPPVRATVTGSPTAALPQDELARAKALLDRKHYAEAAAAYAPLRTAAERSGDEERRFWAGLGWARAQSALGETDAARKELAALRALTRGSPLKEGWIAARSALGRARGGDADGAVEEARAAVELSERASDEELESAAGDALATSLSLAGRYGEALAVDEQRVRRWRSAAAPSPALADALNDLGIDCRHLARLEDAIAAYDEASLLYRRLGDGEGTGRVLFNLANIHLLAGDLDRALALKLEALAAIEKVGSAFGLGLLHADLGELYAFHRNFPLARRHLGEALSILRRSHQKYGELLALVNLAKLALDTGDPGHARELLLEALAQSEGGTLRNQQARVRSELARVEAALGHGQEALRWAAEARSRAAALEDPWIELEALQAWGEALEAAGDTGGASAAYLNAIDLLESARGRVALGDLRLGFAEAYLPVYEGAIRCLLARDRAAEALEVSERSRARLLLELMAERGLERQLVDTPDRKLRERLRERSLALGSAASEEAPRLRAEVEGLASELARFEARAGRGSPEAAARHPGHVRFSEIQHDLLTEGKGLLAYFWGEREVYGWWATASDLHAASLGPAADLAGRVNFLVSALAQAGGPADWRPAAHNLYRRLVAPLRPAGQREVLVLADGPLAYLPLEVLLPAGDAPPWGVTHRIRYGPSAAILTALAQAPPRRAVERALLAVAYSPAPSGGRRPEEPRSRDEERLEPIPFAVREARQASALFRDGRATALVGSEASFAAWKAHSPERYRYLHFAAHARVSDRRPGDTHILLADGPLPLPAIRRLRLGADLVVLSACDTGLGTRVRGEGVVGLPHAFLAAGARAALVSLWRLDDRSAQEFMLAFYGELRDGQPPAEALRRVRAVWAAASDERSHPARWAPFVLVGGG